MNIGQLFNTFLAGILDKFKAKNPILFMIIQVALVCGVVFLWEADDADMFANEEWIATALKYIFLALTALTGTRTFKYKKNPDYPDERPQ